MAAAYGGGRCGTGYQVALILKLVAGDRLTAWDISGTGDAKDRLKGSGQRRGVSVGRGTMATYS
ncbi:hypothetical protein DDE05_24885 [Streptomyces cavourensis]|nr:hypothetical protein DDE05_24885 [Streptomyces cavourensis]